MAHCPQNLPLPALGDSIDLLAPKLSALNRLIKDGQSIAIATGFAATPNHEKDGVKKAVSEMTPDELMCWQSYVENRCQLPVMDWATNVGVPPSSTKSLRLARKRAEALNHIYKTDKATPSHSVWFANNHPEALHLVKAVARVIGVDKNILGGHSTANAILLADLQTINKVLGVTRKIMKKKGDRTKETSLRTAYKTLISRRQQIRALRKPADRKRKRAALESPEEPEPEPKRKPELKLMSEPQTAPVASNALAVGCGLAFRGRLALEEAGQLEPEPELKSEPWTAPVVSDALTGGCGLAFREKPS